MDSASTGPPRRLLHGFCATPVTDGLNMVDTTGRGGAYMCVYIYIHINVYVYIYIYVCTMCVCRCACLYMPTHPCISLVIRMYFLYILMYPHKLYLTKTALHGPENSQ